MNTQSSLVKQLVDRVSVTKSAAPTAAEGQPQSKTCRNLRGARSREASWTAAVLLPLLSRRLSATDSFNHTRLRQLCRFRAPGRSDEICRSGRIGILAMRDTDNER